MCSRAANAVYDFNITAESLHGFPMVPNGVPGSTATTDRFSGWDGVQPADLRPMVIAAISKAYAYLVPVVPLLPSVMGNHQ